MSKRMKIDQVINLIIDDAMSSSSDSNDEEQEERLVTDANISSSDDDVPLSVLMSRRKSISSSDDEDDLPLSVLITRKNSIRKPFQQLDVTQLNNKMPHTARIEVLEHKMKSTLRIKSLLKGIYDLIEPDSDDDCQDSKENQNVSVNKFTKCTKLVSSPVLNFDRSKTKFILSLKSSKRKH